MMQLKSGIAASKLTKLFEKILKWQNLYFPKEWFRS